MAKEADFKMPAFTVSKERLDKIKAAMAEIPNIKLALKGAQAMKVDTTEIEGHLKWGEDMGKRILKTYDPDYKELGPEKKE